MVKQNETHLNTKKRLGLTTASQTLTLQSQLFKAWRNLQGRKNLECLVRKDAELGKEGSGKIAQVIKSHSKGNLTDIILPPP